MSVNPNHEPLPPAGNPFQEPMPDAGRPRHPLERPSAPRRPSEQPPTNAPPARQRVELPTSRPFLSYALIAINVTILVADYYFLDRRLSDLGSKQNAAILMGEYWRFFTPMFLHADPIHVAVNCWSLYVVGRDVERLHGVLRFSAIYFLSGVAGVLMSLALNPADSVGASGAIFGLVGALLPFLYRNRRVLNARQSIQGILITIGLNLGFGLVFRRVDNWAHLGGLIGGLALGWFCAPLYRVVADDITATVRIVDTSSPSRALGAVAAASALLVGAAWLLVAAG